ncbi:MAG: hypothetical protein ABJK37_17605 [Paraglaciecola sp.]|uniref:hypothetical protein n=1 Tax=Paraglaciecola sp. TaxID=1920173 RepID=UPI00329987FA
MPNPNANALQNEWITLQNQFDSYEKCSLVIKLTSVLVCCFVMYGVKAGLGGSLIIAILWLQDGIWKTFQNRISHRLLVVEQAIHDETNQGQTSQLGMQFNLAWNQSRANALGLLSEYIKQSLKPTVAYPYVVLLIFMAVTLYVD